MTTENFIVLTDSLGPMYGMSKKFKAIQMKTPLTRTDGLKYLLDGSIDKSAGVILKSWQYMLRVPFSVDEQSEFGTLEDLQTLFMLNDPNGTPNDTITLTDHYGASFDVFFIGELSPENMTTILDGFNSAYIVNISLQEK